MGWPFANVEKAAIADGLAVGTAVGGVQQCMAWPGGSGSLQAPEPGTSKEGLSAPAKD